MTTNQVRWLPHILSLSFRIPQWAAQKQVLQKYIPGKIASTRAFKTRYSAYFNLKICLKMAVK